MAKWRRPNISPFRAPSPDRRAALNAGRERARHLLERGQYELARPELAPERYDQIKAAKDPKLSEALPGDADIAGIKRREKVAQVYLLEGEGGRRDAKLAARGEPVGAQRIGDHEARDGNRRERVVGEELGTDAVGREEVAPSDPVHRHGDPGGHRIADGVIRLLDEHDRLLQVEDVNPVALGEDCLLYTSPSPRDRTRSRMPSSA